jgi:hypothetical protein
MRSLAGTLLALLVAGGTAAPADSPTYVFPLRRSTNNRHLRCDMPLGSSGTTHFRFDVYGYFK